MTSALTFRPAGDPGNSPCKDGNTADLEESGHDRQAGSNARLRHDENTLMGQVVIRVGVEDRAGSIRVQIKGGAKRLQDGFGLGGARGTRERPYDAGGVAGHWLRN